MNKELAKKFFEYNEDCNWDEIDNMLSVDFEIKLIAGGFTLDKEAFLLLSKDINAVGSGLEVKLLNIIEIEEYTILQSERYRLSNNTKTEFGKNWFICEWSEGKMIKAVTYDSMVVEPKASI